MNFTARIRFLVQNYGLLQGLKAVPIGIAVMIIALWDNLSAETNRDLAFPLVVLFAALIAYEVAYRFYLHKYGNLRRTIRQRLPEFLISFSATVLAYLAFAIDARLEDYFSPLGLVIAIMLLLEYWRVSHPVQGRFLWDMALWATLLLLVSLLPLLGLEHWWLPLGFQSQSIAILFIMGMSIVAMGLRSHAVLRTLLQTGKAEHEPGL